MQYDHHSNDKPLTAQLAFDRKAQYETATVYPATIAVSPAEQIPELHMQVKRSAILSHAKDRLGDYPVIRGNIRLTLDPVETPAKVVDDIREIAREGGMRVIPNGADGGERTGMHVSIPVQELRSFATGLELTGDPALLQVAKALKSYNPDTAPLQLPLKDFRRVERIVAASEPEDDQRRLHSDAYRFQIE